MLLLSEHTTPNSRVRSKTSCEADHRASSLVRINRVASDKSTEGMRMVRAADLCS